MVPLPQTRDQEAMMAEFIKLLDAVHADVVIIGAGARQTERIRRTVQDAVTEVRVARVCVVCCVWPLLMQVWWR